MGLNPFILLIVGVLEADPSLDLVCYHSGNPGMQHCKRKGAGRAQSADRFMHIAGYRQRHIADFHTAKEIT